MVQDPSAISSSANNFLSWWSSGFKRRRLMAIHNSSGGLSTQRSLHNGSL